MEFYKLKYAYRWFVAQVSSLEVVMQVKCTYWSAFMWCIRDRAITERIIC